MSTQSAPQSSVATEGSAGPGALACAASTLFGALAGGVLWCFVSVSTRLDTDALVIPIGLALGAFLRWQGFRGRTGIFCAMLSTAMAFGYAQYLFGAVRIAQMLGLPLREALAKSGFELTADIAWANLRWTDWTLFAIAMVAAALAVAWRTGRPSITQTVPSGG